MLYFEISETGQLTVHHAFPGNDVSRKCFTCWDFDTFALAEGMAARANSLNDGHTYIPVDRGSHTAPRYDVSTLPKVGDPVSYSFNGDSYPCGHVKSISKSLRLVVTTTGEKFYRRGLTCSWLRNGTWSLIKGHVNERNPHF